MRSNIPEIVRDIGVEVGEVREALLNPSEAGDFAAEILRLNGAIDRLREVKARIEETRPGSEERVALESDLRELCGVLDRLAKLADHGEAFWRGWGQMLGLDASGYTQSGLPANLSGAKPTSTKVVA